MKCHPNGYHYESCFDDEQARALLAEVERVLWQTYPPSHMPELSARRDKAIADVRAFLDPRRDDAQCCDHLWGDRPSNWHEDDCPNRARDEGPRPVYCPNEIPEHQQEGCTCPSRDEARRCTCSERGGLVMSNGHLTTCELRRDEASLCKCNNCGSLHPEPRDEARGAPECTCLPGLYYQGRGGHTSTCSAGKHQWVRFGERLDTCSKCGAGRERAAPPGADRGDE